MEWISIFPLRRFTPGIVRGLFHGVQLDYNYISPYWMNWDELSQKHDSYSFPHQAAACLDIHVWKWDSHETCFFVREHDHPKPVDQWMAFFDANFGLVSIPCYSPHGVSLRSSSSRVRPGEGASMTSMGHKNHILSPRNDTFHGRWTSNHGIGMDWPMDWSIFEGQAVTAGAFF